ncbi:DUF3373 family protein [Hydrogenimonas cancrithermarum]|uniref:DUF3373 domain-containing protein n=1 Tax=Hydrogenimonas cancrithermarum TaxID=2993563 RepID=A0ABN6WVR5_9BACT|nr:DUF3373 family protein [Hydrogenimonas cancrithermarum]BDY13058.1 hypothetical protein HCR_13700 [Hydrogenimonas cancrithermarum]
MKKLIAMSTAAAVAATMSFASSDDDLRAELEALKKEVSALKQQTKGIKAKKLKKQISQLKAAALNDNIKWNVDFRTAYDVIGYKYADGASDWNQIFTNRLWLGMGYAPTSNLTFKGTLSYYKMYGQLPDPKMGFNYFDWVVNETPNDGQLRVKEAYWLYFGDDFFGANIPWTASFGRRPATDGLLANYREDQNPKSPIGHIINTEFDGASFKFDLSNVTDVPGMYFKLCMGRGMTNATSRYSGIVSNGDGTYSVNPNATDYSKLDQVSNTDLFGFIFVPYDDGQYSVHTTAFKAWNLPGMETVAVDVSSGQPVPTTYAFMQTGDLYGAAISFIANGIGDGISDMLDESIFFVSFAASKTMPSNDPYQVAIYNGSTSVGTQPAQMDMLGSNDNKTGTSWYAGANWPCQLIDDARVGVEYNHGSKYWRSFTYAEDTLAGSKLAARGDAYEIWFNKDLIGKNLTAQIRYTYIDYKYTGSNGFFAQGGTPLTMDEAQAYGMNPVDKAQDIRMYVRYRY